MTETSAATPLTAFTRLVFISTTRLHYDAQGRLRSYNPLMSTDEWAPFRELFGDITIIARVDENDTSSEGYVLDESTFNVVALPFYNGILEFCKKALLIHGFIGQYLRDPFAVYYVWVPNIVAFSAARRIKAVGAPLLVRVIGDSDGVARSIIPRPFNVLVAKLTTRMSRSTVKLADAVIYVTLRALQGKYPSRKGASTLARTNVQLSQELLSVAQEQRDIVDRAAGSISLIAVGSQEQNYKGHDLLIDAVAILQKEGYDVSLTLIGTGRLHADLKRQALELEVKNVTFKERLGTSLDVARYVKECDLFVMPSRTEGMPKALLEAMAVGVLSIGSKVGGIPEVLEDVCTFEPESSEAIASTVRVIAADESLADEQRNKQAEMIKAVKEQYSGAPVLKRFLRNFLDGLI